ncbi:MAG: leucine-rich repeat domain-containing protein, partial [Paludibacteraceae bacterium]|nr:leucine-rich repeat domain-containing protein [Paludibacteraceae bacterium]
MKKLFTLFLALAASVGTIFAESGTCGENLTWTLENGVLTISGTGAMRDYRMFEQMGSMKSDAPWFEYGHLIKTVIIKEGVTRIGDTAFFLCYNLTSVTISNSVISIGNGAFGVCKNLTSVTIPNSVTTIENGVFWECSNLISVTIPNNVTSIGNWVFDGCSSLASPIYCDHIFAHMPKNYSGAYAIPNGIETIAGGAFKDCSGLTSVSIPNSVTYIG